MGRLTCPSVRRFPHSVFKGPPAHVSTLSRPAPAGIRPVIRDGQRRSQPPCPAFLPPFGCRHSLLGHPCWPGSYAPLTIGLPAARSCDGWTLTRFPCSARVRHDWGWLSSLPRGRRCPHGQKSIFGRRLPPLNGRPLPPCAATRHQGVRLTRHQQGFTGIQPIPSLPLTCDPRTDRGSLGFTLSFAPGRTGPSHARQGRDGPWTLTRTTSPFSTSPPPTYSLNTCDLTSHCSKQQCVTLPGRAPPPDCIDGLTGPRENTGVGRQPHPIFTPARRPRRDIRTACKIGAICRMWSLTWDCGCEGVRWDRVVSDAVVVRFGGQHRPVARPAGCSGVSAWAATARSRGAGLNGLRAREGSETGL
jgi:hypothetical protein